MKKLHERMQVDGVKRIQDGEWHEVFGDRCMILDCPTKEKWLELRRSFICASESACLLGLGFHTNFAIWRDKTGVEPIVVEDNEVMRKGRDNEALSREQFAIDHDCKVLDGTNKLVVDLEHEDKDGYPFMAATFDAIGIGADGNPFDIEFKRSESYKLFSNPDEMPDKYRAQVIKQMVVGGFNLACLHARVVNTSPYDLRVKKIYERDYWLDASTDDVSYDMEKLVEVETKFWNEHVLTNIPPATVLPRL